jgi:hypothetical protein
VGVKVWGAGVDGIPPCPAWYFLLFIYFPLAISPACDLAGQVTGLFPYGGGEIGVHRVVLYSGRRIYCNL